MSDLIELLKNRRTVRLVGPEPVPDDLVEGLLEAACLAPSAHNRQPWRFAVVRSVGARQALAQAMAEAFRRDLGGDSVAEPEIEARVDGSVSRLTAAPVLVVACLAAADLDLYPDATRQAAEHVLGVQSVAAAVQNLLLAAAERGLGAGWMCAPLFCQDVARRALDLPAGWEPQALVTIGWPAEMPAPREAVPMETRVVFR